MGIMERETVEIKGKTGMLIRKAKYIRQREGLFALTRRALLFFARSIFDHRTYYIYENTSDGMIEFKPGAEELTFKVISAPQEIDGLARKGFDIDPYIDNNFDLDIGGIKKRIDQGAILFCTFVGKEIASVVWLALNEEVKKDIDIVPYPVNYGGEACLGDGQTIPKYRRLGVYTHCVSQICQFAHEKGIKLRFTIPEGIIPIFKVHNHVGSNICGQVNYWKFLIWETWREKPISQNVKVTK